MHHRLGCSILDIKIKAGARDLAQCPPCKSAIMSSIPGTKKDKRQFHSQVWWHMPVTQALKRLRQEVCHKFEAILEYTVRCYPQKTAYEAIKYMHRKVPSVCLLSFVCHMPLLRLVVKFCVMWILQCVRNHQDSQNECRGPPLPATTRDQTYDLALTRQVPKPLSYISSQNECFYCFSVLVEVGVRILPHRVMLRHCIFSPSSHVCLSLESPDAKEEFTVAY